MIDTPSDAAVPARHGKAWSAKEDRELYDGFVGGQSMDLLASTHERAAGGVRARLFRLGMIDQDGSVVEPPPPFTAIERHGSKTSGEHDPAAEPDGLRPIFAVRTSDGWIVELSSNHLLSKELVDRLTAMLHRVVSEDDHSPIRAKGQ